jgi:hypothetical protein
MRTAAAFAVGLLFLAGAPRKALGQDVTISLSFAGSEYRQGGAVPLKYTVTNRESRPVAVLKWNTPLEGLIGNPLVVRHDGAERNFFGAMVLRTDPITSDWAVIPPKGSVSATVDVASAYDLSAPGEYQVQARQGFQHVEFDAIPKITRKALRRREARSNTVAFRMLDGGPAPGIPMTPPGAAAISFNGCDGDQQSSLTKAFTAMSTEASKVSSDVAGWRDCTAWLGSKPATVFLGTCAAGSVAKAQYVTSTINDRGPSAILDCTGTTTCAGGASHCAQGNVLAFTCLGGYKSTIYVCPKLFFGLPVVNELDSQQTALYHELSHWANTLDYAYGCKACADLASSKPVEAQNNASSYMYFAIFQSTGNNPSCGCGVSRIGAPTSGWSLAMLTLVVVGWRGRRTRVQRHCASRASGNEHRRA